MYTSAYQYISSWFLLVLLSNPMNVLLAIVVSFSTCLSSAHTMARPMSTHHLCHPARTYRRRSYKDTIYTHART
ncbi:hypothetical protein B0H15DRAFT_869979 [Mycena belliarum]|uniref:Uncharacterized protein n=1 Tax=Mycena belliarum TaxID=1033014 RepID=A0AAD6TSL4_9AGAR|nr:hypothetical protein B0H15DRAFT_869979 [Mycena belliae]